MIDKDGNQVGIVSVEDALKSASESKLDLVEVAGQASPPVCRIMDYGKYLYERTKRERDAKKKQKTIEVKEIRMRPSIGEHDYEVKRKHVEKFIERGDKVKVTIMFRGREMAHKENGRSLLERVKNDLQDIAKVDAPPRMFGRRMIMVLSPAHGQGQD